MGEVSWSVIEIRTNPLPRRVVMKQHEMPLADLGRRTVLGAVRRSRWVAVAMAVVAIAGCESSDGSPGATVPEPTTSTTISVATVPDTITVEYAQAVMDELDRVLGDAIRELVSAKAPSDAFIARLKAVYAEPQYTKEADLYGEDAANEFKGYRIPPGDPSTRVKEIIASTQRCVLFRADRSFAAMQTQTSPGVEALIQLVRNDVRSSFNRTAWVVVADTPADEAEVPSGVCT